MPYRRSRRSPATVRRLFLSDGQLSLVPQPALPQVPVHGSRSLAQQAGGQPVAGGLFSRRLHPTPATGTACTPQPALALRSAVSRRLRNPARDRRRSTPSRCTHRGTRRTPYLEPGSAPPSSPALPGSRRWTRPRSFPLDRLPTRLLPAGARTQPSVPGQDLGLAPAGL